jgi:hypothetical protein
MTSAVAAIYRFHVPPIPWWAPPVVGLATVGVAVVILWIVLGRNNRRR